ncbi:MAG: translocation/assembly module TamB domain-containing protein [Nitrospirae bacterium]|nr:translocation/assembly module TamB domain-containing protein [Nitrospirota bacterium]
MAQRNNKKIIIRLLFVLLLLGIVHFLFRGPYLSNSIKRVIIPVLEEATGKHVIMDKAVINLFPFYLQGKSVKFYDDEGKTLLWITKSRIYLDPLGLLSKDITIRRVILTEPEARASENELSEIASHITDYFSGNKGSQFKVALKSLKVVEGKFTYPSPDEMDTFYGSGLNADIFIKDGINIDVKLSDGKFIKKGHSGFDYSMEGSFSIADNLVKAAKVIISSSDSTIAASGEMLIKDGRIGNGKFNGKAVVNAIDVCRIFGVEKTRDGALTLSGSVVLINKTGSRIPEFELDLETDGYFYLETLMDILDVKERVTGRLALKGGISGIFPEITGRGDASITDAEFGELAIESGLGSIVYSDRRFSLSDFTAHTYGGVLNGKAYIEIPKGDFGVTASASEVDSVKFLQYIGWDAPFRPGKVSGKFDLKKVIGQEIYVNAHLNYLNAAESDEKFTDRLKAAEGDILFHNGIVSVSNSKLSTPMTFFSLDGGIDIDERKIDIDVNLKSSDISDITAPYYTNIFGPVNFDGKAKGMFEAPVISGVFKMGAGNIHGFDLSGASAEIIYSKDSLIVASLIANHDVSVLELKGDIDFRNAEGLFSYGSPYYHAEASFKNIRSEMLDDLLFRDVELKGFVTGNLSFTGDRENFSGTGSLRFDKGSIYEQGFDRASADMAFDPARVVIKSAEIANGSSKIAGSGKIFSDDRFELSAHSEKMNSDDISYLKALQLTSLFSFDINGTGTFENPHIDFTAGIMGSTFRGIETGKGNIRGSLKGNRLAAKCSLFEGKVTADAEFLVAETPSWELNVVFNEGRYDFLLAGLIKDPPQDMSVFLDGRLNARSDKGKVALNSRFKNLSMDLYGYNIRNSGDIILDFRDGLLEIKSFSLAGKDANFDISGNFSVGKSLNLSLEGDVDLLPLKALTKKLSFLEGRGNFAIDIKGDWDKPEIVGELDVRNTTIGFSGFPHRIGPLEGRVFFNRDKVIFDSVKSSFAGGTAVLYGAGYLNNKMRFEKLLVSSDLKDIKLSPIKGVNAVFGGKLFFETSAKGTSLTGEIIAEKAQYKKDVEFSSIFSEIREIETAPSNRTWLDDVLLNVRIEGKDGIVIDNNIAKAPVSVNLTMTGTAAKYGLLGTVEAKTGTIFFRGNEFNILEKSSVDFVSSDKVSPVFHITAEALTGGYRIKMNLDGPLDNFTLSLFSYPHLSETDILTLLSFGRLSTEGKGVEGGMAASQATSMLTGGIQSEVEEGFKHVTGFDRFEVEPRTTATGSVTPKITVGKRFLNDRLSIIYSTFMGSTEENVIKMEYDLGNNISLIGLRDEIGSAGGDIKYKFKFK